MDYINNVVFIPLYAALVLSTAMKARAQADTSTFSVKEYGTAAEALLELYNPDASVFGSKPFPVQSQADIKSLSYAKGNIKMGKTGLSDGDGSVGDPAALGVAAVMLGKSDKRFADGATTQLNYMLQQAPRTDKGAISHRASSTTLWADFMYMAPPFMAFYGADAGNSTLLKEAYNQCNLYRDALHDGGSNLWKHVVGPDGADPGHWSTGNAWAAAGMTRVLAAILKAPDSTTQGWKDQAVIDLKSWIKEIIDAVMAAETDNGLIRNYVDDKTPDHGYGEWSGTVMFSDVIFRMAVIAPEMLDQKYVAWAQKVGALLGGKDKDGKPYVTPEGIVRPTVDPMNWQSKEPFEKGSPEGQAMVTLAYAAYRDCIAASKCSEGGVASNTTSQSSSPSASSSAAAKTPSASQSSASKLTRFFQREYDG